MIINNINIVFSSCFTVQWTGDGVVVARRLPLMILLKILECSHNEKSFHCWLTLEIGLCHERLNTLLKTLSTSSWSPSKADNLSFGK